MITHLEPDILKCEVKGALGSIPTNKARGGDGIPAELFQILKDDAVQVLRIPIPKKGNAKECSNYHTVPLISHANKVMLKNLQARLNSTWTKNFQMFKIDLEMAKEPKIKLPTFVGSSKKQESSRKTSTSALLTMPKPLTVWITTNCGKFFKRWDCQTT